jgi:hypothetical protein
VDPFQRKVDNMLTKTTDTILTKVVLGCVLGVDVVDLILSWE